MNVCEIEYVSARALIQRKQTLLTVSGALIVMPFTQPAQAQQALQLMARRAHAPGLLLGVHDEDGVGFVNLINQTFRATHSAFFGYVAQDAFAGREWLDSALIGLGKQGVLLGFNDGKWPAPLLVLVWLSGTGQKIIIRAIFFIQNISGILRMQN